MPMTRADVIERLKAVLAKADSQKGAADALGVSPQYLNDVIHKRRKPGKKLLRALKLKAVEAYEARP